MKTYEWAIIGGGLHGCHMAFMLLHKGAHHDDVIIASEEPPLHNWYSQTSKTKMPYMRSGIDMHLDPDKDSLRAFVQKRGLSPDAPIGIATFNDHCMEVYKRFNPQLWTASITRVEETPGGWSLESSRGRIQAKRVVMAVGQGVPNTEGWATPSRHIFHTDIAKINNIAVVVGGGMSAAHVTTWLASQGHQVTMVSPEYLKEEVLDFVAEYATDPMIEKFSRWAPHNRLLNLPSIRLKGSINSATLKALLASGATIKQGVRVTNQGTPVCHACGQITTPARKTEKDIELSDGTVIKDGTLILCTGFHPMPTLPEIKLRGKERLPIYDGVLMPNSQLRLAKGLYVMGAPAEVVIGPVARLIKGARVAAERIMR